MELIDAIRHRRSIRQFLPKPVPEEMIKEIVSEALWSPSWGNTQPWEIIAAAGAALDQFKRENAEALMNGQPADADIPIPGVWPDALKARYKGVGKQVLTALEIAREDHEGRNRYYQQMFSFFDATALLMFLVDHSLSLEYAMLDIGLILQSVCLLAHEQGLGTCILAASINYSNIARRIMKIDESKKIVIGAALGWPDPDAKVNHFERERGKIDEFLKFI